MIEALVFDAYGTLFDVHSVVARCEELWPGKGSAVSQLWRAKQLEYTWQRTLMGRYQDFERVTADALRYSCEMLALDCGQPALDALMDEYRRLKPFAEVLRTLPQLKSRKLAILSNGSPEMLAAVCRHNGLDAILDAVLSVDGLKIYKPDPRVYAYAADRLGVDKRRIGFVSSNCWDACGAKSFGFRTFWINRTGAPVDRLGAEPDARIASLDELLPLLT